MGSQLLVVLLPGFVAAAIGYVLFVSPTLGVAVGAAAGMAAGTWLLITSALFASLLVARRAWTRFRQPSWPRAPPG